MRIILKKFLLLTVAGTCFIWPAAEANAAIVTYNFAGAWDSYSSSGTLFPSLGDTFSGTFTYDDSTPDTSGTPGYSVYAPTGMITTTFGGGTFANTPTPYNQYLTSAGSPSSSPFWQLQIYNCNSATCGTSGDSGGDFNGNALGFLYNVVYLYGDATADTGGAIDPLALSSYLGSQFYLQAGYAYDPIYGYESAVTGSGHLTSLDLAPVSEVPLPAALPLLLAGLTSLGFLGRRARRSSVGNSHG